MYVYNYIYIYIWVVVQSPAHECHMQHPSFPWNIYNNMHSVEDTVTTCININAPDHSSSCQMGFVTSWWRKLAENQRRLHAFFLGPQRACAWPYACSFWLAWIICMALCPMHNFLIRFGAPKLYAFPVCKCYAFLNILLGYPLCLTTTHKYIILILILYKYIGFRYNYILIDMESPFLHGPFSSFFPDSIHLRFVGWTSKPNPGSET